jgi:hypothetical protein
MPFHHLLLLILLHPHRPKSRPLIHSLPNPPRKSLRPRDLRPQEIHHILLLLGLLVLNRQLPHLHSKSYPTTCPVHSPLPPVPTYNPEKYKNFPPLHLHGKKSSSGPPPPPRPAYTLKRRGSQGTLRVVLRSPSCPLMVGDHSEDISHNKAAQVKKDDSNTSKPIVNKPLARTQSLSAESISSIYSRSQSGDDPEPTKITHRTTNPATTTTIDRNLRPYQQQQIPGILNLRATLAFQQGLLNPRQAPSRPASRPRPQSGARPGSSDNGNGRILVRNHLPGPGHQRDRKTASAEEVRSRSRSRSSRLPVTRAVSGFGDVRDWSGGGGGAVASGEMMGGGTAQPGHMRGNGSGWAARCGLPPLPVEKARYREI